MKRDGQEIAVQSSKSMSAKQTLLSLLAAIFISGIGWAAPSYSPSRSTVDRSQKEDLSNAFRQAKVALNDLKHEISNHETEIRQLDNRLESQESSLENLRQQLADGLKTERDQTQMAQINIEGKLESFAKTVEHMETLSSGFTNDLRQLRTQGNESVILLGQYKQKIQEMEKVIEAQHQHMKSLETALHSVIDLVKAKETTKEIALRSETPRTYKVQSGDTLDKIAKSQKVSLQALREANHLANDRILVGQTLKIPL